MDLRLITLTVCPPRFNQKVPILYCASFIFNNANRDTKGNPHCSRLGLEWKNAWMERCLGSGENSQDKNRSLSISLEWNGGWRPLTQALHNIRKKPCSTYWRTRSLNGLWQVVELESLTIGVYSAMSYRHGFYIKISTLCPPSPKLWWDSQFIIGSRNFWMPTGDLCSKKYPPNQPTWILLLPEMCCQIWVINQQYHSDMK